MALLTAQGQHESSAFRNDEAEKVDAWERDQFERLGFEEPNIELLLSKRVSWHDVDDLLRGGCCPALALLIVL